MNNSMNIKDPDKTEKIFNNKNYHAVRFEYDSL